MPEVGCNMKRCEHWEDGECTAKRIRLAHTVYSMAANVVECTTKWLKPAEEAESE